MKPLINEVILPVINEDVQTRFVMIEKTHNGLFFWAQKWIYELKNAIVWE